MDLSKNSNLPTNFERLGIIVRSKPTANLNYVTQEQASQYIFDNYK
jgi:hypothetical protein